MLRSILITAFVVMSGIVLLPGKSLADSQILYSEDFVLTPEVQAKRDQMRMTSIAIMDPGGRFVAMVIYAKPNSGEEMAIGSCFSLERLPNGKQMIHLTEVIVVELLYNGVEGELIYTNKEASCLK